jgi:hypothetical protein
MLKNFDGIIANCEPKTTSTWYKIGLEHGRDGREWTCRAGGALNARPQGMRRKMERVLRRAAMYVPLLPRRLFDYCTAARRCR